MQNNHNRIINQYNLNKILAFCKRIISDYIAIAPYRKIIHDHGAMAIDHKKIIHDYKLITADHRATIADYGKIIHDHGAIIADHKKIIADCSVITHQGCFVIKLHQTIFFYLHKPTFNFKFFRL